jgi:hypothetical protein
MQWHRCIRKGGLVTSLYEARRFSVFFISEERFN